MNNIPELKEWNETLKINLTKNIKDFTVYLYFLDNEFIKAYHQSHKVKYENYISKIINGSKIMDLPYIFPLEEENLKIFGIKTENENEIKSGMGEYANNVLVFQFKPEERIYCFYFLDKNEELNQGYLRFYRENTENEMINSLKVDGVESLFEKYKIKPDTGLFQSGINFEIILHNLEEEIEEEKKEKEMKIDYKKIMNSIKNSQDEIKNSIVKNNRRMSCFSAEDASKIEKIPTKKRKTSFSKGDKDTDDKDDKEEKKKKGVFSKITKIFKKNVEPGIKGLRNVGATCYMNATLQCFSNSDKIKTELINKYQEYKKN